MQAPQGALFFGKIPETSAPSIAGGSLILDGIQDPGNLGTILRTADALNVPVLLTDGCADPYSPKTIRASMGAVFRTVPVRTDREEAAALCRSHGIPLIAAALSPRAKDIRSLDLKGAAVIVGSEGQGISPELLALTDGELIIPMNERCESLNAAVAAVIVMWQMTE